MSHYTLTDLERVLGRCVEGDRGCWLWTGGKSSKGYGLSWIPSKKTTRQIHRVVYEGLRDEIPAGLQIDHLCRVRHCCNPWHLEPVTARVNIQRGNGSWVFLQAPNGICRRGHVVDGTRPNGHAYCRTCDQATNRRPRDRREYQRAYYQRRKALRAGGFGP